VRIPPEDRGGGAPPTRERRDFLSRLVGSFRDSARVLLLHGRASTSAGEEWEACNRALTLAFLASESLPEPNDWRIGKASIRRWVDRDRTVFHTWALNGGALARRGASAEYVDRLAELVAAAI